MTHVTVPKLVCFAIHRCCCCFDYYL